MNLKIRRVLPIVAIWWIAMAACGMITGITISNNLKDRDQLRKDSWLWVFFCTSCTTDYYRLDNRWFSPFSQKRSALMQTTTISITLDHSRIILFSYLIPFLISYYFLKKTTRKHPLLYALLLAAITGTLLAFATIGLSSAFMREFTF